MLEQIILGVAQGIFEWLPVSSEGLLILIKRNFFGSAQNLEVLIQEILFLHLGTFLAVLVYFRRDVIALFKTFFDYQSAQEQDKRILVFLVITTLVSGLIGFGLLKALEELEETLLYSTKMLTGFIGLCLLITGVLQIKAPQGGYKKEKELKNKDGFLLGLMQGLAALPGLSRSGLTVSGLLLRKFNEGVALKLSFLMSLPIVLGGNIVFNLKYLSFSKELAVALFFSFIFGILTIDLLLRLAKKMRFGWFVFIFGILIIISIFV